MPPSPAARKLIAESGLQRGTTSKGSGRRGQVLKQDVLEARSSAAAMPRARSGSRSPSPRPRARPSHPDDASREERVRMTRLRQTIAKRLKEAQDTAAMLTTFNDVDMGAVMQLRSDYREAFEKKHGVKLGFMGFFVKAAVAGAEGNPRRQCRDRRRGHRLQELLPYRRCRRHRARPGRAGVARRRSLEPRRDRDAIADFGARAREGKLALEELQGGTFTISNGGIYGSLLSTPILNAPQSGILGMHRIEERAVVRDGQIVARPMMYLALSYDHRLVDGKEAVTFLVRVKEAIEDPKRLVLNI